MQTAVVIAALNAADTIDSALASIAGQTTAASEVIVVDDGCTDDTLERVAAWSSVLPIVVTQSGGRRGPGPARAVGIEAVSSTLIACLDADDVWLPDHLQIATEAYAANPGLIAADALRWVPGQALSARSQHDGWPVPRQDQHLALLTLNFVPCASSAVFARSAYHQAGGFRGGIAGVDDWDLWIRMLRLGLRCVPTAPPTVLYRQSATSMSGDDRLVDVTIRMLEIVLGEVRSDAERRACQLTLRRLRARRGLLAAYDEVRAGRPGRARAEATRLLVRTPRSVAVRAAVMAIAPRYGTTERDRRRWQPTRWSKD